MFVEWTSRVNSITVMGLIACTARNYWSICETQQSLERVLLPVSAAGAHYGAGRSPVSVYWFNFL